MGGSSEPPFLVEAIRQAANLNASDQSFARNGIFM
jgi:hypothetical protein